MKCIIYLPQLKFSMCTANGQQTSHDFHPWAVLSHPIYKNKFEIVGTPITYYHYAYEDNLLAQSSISSSFVDKDKNNDEYRDIIEETIIKQCT